MRTEYERLRPPQWCGYPPAGRLFECANLGADLSLIFVRQTVRIGEHSNGTIDVQMGTEALGEPLGDVERDIVQCMQFVDDDGLDQLIDADRANGLW
jgi:hypothetical protein